jgi:hypothetical protein
MSLLPGRSRQGVVGVACQRADPHRLPLDKALRRSGGALQGFRQQTRGFTRLPLKVLPGTAPLCRGASPATSPSQSEGSGQIAGPVRDACPAQARALSPLLAPRRLASAPQEQRIRTSMHRIGYLSRGRSPPLRDGEGAVLHPFPGERSESLTRSRRLSGRFIRITCQVTGKNASSMTLFTPSTSWRHLWHKRRKRRPLQAKPATGQVVPRGAFTVPGGTTMAR